MGLRGRGYGHSSRSDTGSGRKENVLDLVFLEGSLHDYLLPISAASRYYMMKCDHRIAAAVSQVSSASLVAPRNEIGHRGGRRLNAARCVHKSTSLIHRMASRN